MAYNFTNIKKQLEKIEDDENIDKYIIDERDRIFQKTRKDTFMKYYNNLSVKTVSFSNKEKLYDEKLLDELYDINKSITQSLRNTTGKNFEKIIENLFLANDINFIKQVFIDKDGFIHKNKKMKQEGHVVDFIIPNIEYGKNIKKEKCLIISCKTTIRERYLQDMFYGKFCLISMEKIKNNKILSICVDKNKKEFTKFLHYLINLT